MKLVRKISPLLHTFFYPNKNRYFPVVLQKNPADIVGLITLTTTNLYSMRAKSKKTGGYTIYAVSGTNTISFAIDFRQANTKGLLGFSVEKIDHKNGERKYVDGFKVFEDIIPKPNKDTIVSTYVHLVQSFVWDDFACYEDTEYEYLFYPVKGTAKKQDRTAPAISVTIKTEPLFTVDQEHDIFFNRGVASSQAYRRKFFNLAPDKIINPEMKQKALDWLSRDLDNALLRFIAQAKPGDTLLGCFYEFNYMPVLKAFKAAIDLGVHVKLIVDGKIDNAKDDQGRTVSVPRTKTLESINFAGIPDDNIILREAEKNAIQHNKFIVFKDQDRNNAAVEVWTGSTNITMGGIHGQTNVGHWVKNKDAAEKYEKYWKILSRDPGGRETDDAATKKKKRADLKQAVEALQPNIDFESWDQIPVGITPVFSPRSGPSMLETYVGMFDSAEKISCITLAFGINKLFKDSLTDNTAANHISLLLLEKKDAPNPKSKDPFVFVGARQNVYQAWGSYIEDDLYQWAKETTTRNMNLNKHVAYIHSKFLLVDPLTTDPVIVTGSANFSTASTNNNDENMLIIRGNTRVADIYFTEFNRLFQHYYFRAVHTNVAANKRTVNESLFLCPNDEWLKKYQKGKFRYKRVAMLSEMQGFNM